MLLISYFIGFLNKIKLVFFNFEVSILNNIIMRKIILVLVVVLTSSLVNAQEKKGDGQTSEGKWLIEVNTGFGTPMGANTGFSYSSTNGDSVYNIGAEAGYFVVNDLAVKVGLGYGGMNTDIFDTNIFSYKIGAKYYIVSMFPVQVDYSGATMKDEPEDPSYLGLQAGYAWFLGSNVSIEPGIRYNLSLNDNYSDQDTFQVNVGFALHF
jgi:hypothetical protein